MDGIMPSGTDDLGMMQRRLYHRLWLMRLLRRKSKFIRNNPRIMRKWHPDVNLMKEHIDTIPVWIKIHGVVVTAFNKDGLSAFATKLCTPLMFDSYTSDMCMQSWGREGYYTCNIRVEYEWKPPSSPSTTPVIKKVDKIEKLIIDGNVTLMDDEGKPLEKVDYSAKKDEYGTQSFLEQWKESYENDDYEYDQYADDMYEGQEIPKKLQVICDNLDIRVRGRRKK
ncbi:putative reverse transcriptase domain-containing protein [Tanacetum coccineum]